MKSAQDRLDALEASQARLTARVTALQAEVSQLAERVKRIERFACICSDLFVRTEGRFPTDHKTVAAKEFDFIEARGTFLTKRCAVRIDAETRQAWPWSPRSTFRKAIVPLSIADDCLVIGLFHDFAP